jgi:mRNA interferase HicA
LPVVPGSAVIKALEKLGYEVVRTSGSHHRLKHPERSALSIPVHNRDMKPGTLRAVVRQAGLTVEEFISLL